MTNPVGRPPIGPKVQTHVTQGCFDLILAEVEERFGRLDGRGDLSAVLRDVIEDGCRARYGATDYVTANLGKVGL